MKELNFLIYTREELKERYDKDCEVIRKFEAEIASGKRLSDFGKFCYQNAIKSRDENERYLNLDREVFIFLRGKLVDLTYDEINL